MLLMGRGLGSGVGALGGNEAGAGNVQPVAGRLHEPVGPATRRSQGESLLDRLNVCPGPKAWLLEEITEFGYQCPCED